MYVAFYLVNIVRYREGTLIYIGAWSLIIVIITVNYIIEVSE